MLEVRATDQGDPERPLVKIATYPEQWLLEQGPRAAWLGYLDRRVRTNLQWGCSRSLSTAEERPLVDPVEVGKHLIVDPRVCHGQLTFKGTRVPVETVLYFLSTGRTIEQLLEDWPQLKREAVVEAILLAREALVERYAGRNRGAHEPAHPG
jgi:uncharacterized protein (DUF433 family)